MQTDKKKTGLSTLFDEINEKYKNNAWNIFEDYQKYKAYYDRKAKAQPLKVGDYVYLLDPRQQAQADKIPIQKFNMGWSIQGRESVITFQLHRTPNRNTQNTMAYTEWDSANSHLTTTYRTPT